MSEIEWRTVPSWPMYEASSVGTVRRREPKEKGSPLCKEMRGTRHHTGYLQVTVYREDGRQASRYVHRLVAEAFHGPAEPRQQARHLDGDPENNRPDNLRWGSGAENTRDQVRHGTHRSTVRGTATHCAHGHEFTPENTRRRASGRRECVACIRNTNAEQYRKRKQMAPTALIDTVE
jgi:hypothetical protein